MRADDVMVREAAPEDAAALDHLTWNFYRPMLSMDAAARRDIRAVVLAAWHNGQAVGLATSMRTKNDPNAQALLSLSVVPAARRRGIGRTLLRALRGTLAGQEVAAIETQYSDRLPGAEGFAALLRADGWETPEATHRRICGPVRETFSVFRQRAGILERLDRQGFQARTWRQDGARAVAIAQTLLDSGEAPRWADPRPWLDRLHPEASMVLVTPEGDVRGWVVCQHQQELSRWHFPIGWVREPEAGRGWLLGAYAEGARRLGLAHGDDTRVVVESTRMLPGMWRVLDRHFVPYADWSDHLMECRRPLTPTS